MRIIRRPAELRRLALKYEREGRRIGFVPTMGALHEGHLSLVRRARRESDCVIVSIFVNPLQFGPAEDFGRYPRPRKRDRLLLEKERADILFMPAVRDLYGSGFSTGIDPEYTEEGRRLTSVLCGKYRPGHFRGVCTVVLKLFELTRPRRAYFGAKDYQQGVVISRMIRDLDLPVTFVRCPTVREPDGLAMSSRNAYLSPEGRRRAAAVPAALFAMRERAKKDRRASVARLRGEALGKLRRAVDSVQYLEILDPETLRPLAQRRPRMLAAAACFVDKTRLIDNVIIPG